jgi:hypothetical protein
MLVDSFDQSKLEWIVQMFLGIKFVKNSDFENVSSERNLIQEK